MSVGSGIGGVERGESGVEFRGSASVCADWWTDPKTSFFSVWVWCAVPKDVRLRSCGKEDTLEEA